MPALERVTRKALVKPHAGVQNFLTENPPGHVKRRCRRPEFLEDPYPILEGITTVAREQKVSSAEQKVSSAEQKVSSAEQKVSSAEQKVSSVEQKVSSVEQKVSSAEQKVSSADQEI